MDGVTLYGVSLSSYVRTTRLALEEKGVAYDLVENRPQSAEQLQVHPFGKVPAFAHGKVRLFETPAIVKYVDAVFNGPALQPDDPVARARMNQWISAFSDYFYPTMVTDIIIQRVVVPMRGGTTDEARVAVAAEQLSGYLTILDHELGQRPFIAGDTYSLGDMFYLPAFSNLVKLPEGRLLHDKINVRAWYDEATSRGASVKIGIGL